MFDIAIIGLGPAGLEFASLAIKNNLSVIAFEDKDLGGACLNRGCIPTKAILHTASLYEEIDDFNELGIDICCEKKYNWNKICDRNKNIISKFNKSLDLFFSKNLTLIKEKASIKIKNNIPTIIANDIEYNAMHIVIATGSTAIELPNLKFDKEFVLNSDDMFMLDELPKSIAIIGSGAIGLEWAYILSAFNVNVKLIEKAKNIAPNMDIDIQKRIERILKSKKIEIYKDDFITNIENASIKLNSNKTFSVDKVLLAVGRKPVLPNIDTKLEINNDFSTNIKNLYVIGDASNNIMLAHNAVSSAKILFNKIFNNKELELKNIPSVIYINPEISSVGIKEQDIINTDDYKVVKYFVPSIAKSWCDNANDGLFKIILKDNLIKGAHIACKNSCEFISLFSFLIEKKIPKDEITKFIIPHPSYSEGLLEALKNV